MGTEVGKKNTTFTNLKKMCEVFNSKDCQNSKPLKKTPDPLRFSEGFG